MTNEMGAARRYLTAKRRELIGYMTLEYSLRQPLDARNAEEMAGQESWAIDLVDHLGRPGGAIGRATVHRVPLANGQWLNNETDAGDYVPGWPVVVVTDGFDWLSKPVLRRIGNPERSDDTSFLVVENMTLNELWTGLNLEALVLARVLTRLVTTETLFAVAEPAIRHPEGFRERVEPSHGPVFEALGFSAFKQGVWMSDLVDIWRRQEVLNARFGVTESESRWN